MYKDKDNLGRDRWYCDEDEVGEPIMVTDANGNSFPMDSPEGAMVLQEYENEVAYAKFREEMDAALARDLPRLGELVEEVEELFSQKGTTNEI